MGGRISYRMHWLAGSSEVALLYNDKAVLENHHVSATFRLVRDDSHNILLSLSKDDYKYAALNLLNVCYVTYTVIHRKRGSTFVIITLEKLV